MAMLPIQMIATESLGLGTCMIGSVGPFLKNTGKDFKQKYDLPNKMRDSIVVIMGYPLVEYKKTIDRTLKEVGAFQFLTYLP